VLKDIEKLSVGSECSRRDKRGQFEDGGYRQSDTEEHRGNTQPPCYLIASPMASDLEHLQYVGGGG
jgi:hypothetical protein